MKMAGNKQISEANGQDKESMCVWQEDGVTTEVHKYLPHLTSPYLE